MRHLNRLLIFVAACLAFGILPSAAYAATNVYYSVGQNTTDHKTGSPTVTLSSGTATFSIAQTATNMGVGDKVTYSGSTVAYISARISSTQWSLVTATGGTPGDVSGQTVNSIAHSFASLAAAVDGSAAGADALLGTGDLVVGNYILNIPVYYDSGQDTSEAYGTGATGIGGTRYATGPSNYIRIYAPSSTTTEANTNQSPQGKYSATKFTSSNFFQGLQILANNVRLDGLQVDRIVLSARDSAAAINDLITNCIISKGINPSQSSSNAVQLDDSIGADNTNHLRNLKLYNNVITGWDRGFGGGSQAFIFDGHIEVYNNTFFNIGGQVDYYITGSNVFLKNNILASSTGSANFNTHTYSAGSGHNSTDSSSLNYTVTGGASGDKVSQTFSFVNSTGTDPNLDLHLTGTDAGARNFGVDISSGDANLNFSTDIDGDARPQQSIWDIGADEYMQTTSAPTVTSVAASSVATSTATLNATIVSTGGVDATQSGFAYGTVSDLSTVISTSTLGAQTGTASFSQNLTGLSQNTPYYFRGYATNTSGTSYGNILSFTTGSVPVLTTSPASDFGQLAVTGRASISSTGGYTVTARGFAYGLTTAYGATTTASGLFLTGAFAGPITGLSCNTPYHIRAYATNSNGTGFGGDQSFTTAACVTVSTYALPRTEVFAPGWLALSDRIITQHAGEYIKFAVSNTANISLTFDTSLATSTIYVTAVVDGATTTDSYVGVGSTTMRIASGLSAGRHEVFFEVKALLQDNERWTDQTTMLQIQNVYLDSGSSMFTPGGANAVRPTYSV